MSTMKDIVPQIEGYRFTKIKQIKKGMSGDCKFCLQDGKGERYLLRLSDSSEYERKQFEFEFLQRLSEKDFPVPKPVSFGVDRECVFTLLSWVEGEEAEKVLPKLSFTEQYRFGVEAGKILKGIHNEFPVASNENWQKRYFAVMEERLNAYRAEGIPFKGSEIVLKYLDEKKGLLAERPQTRHHGDYHMGNLIIGKSGTLSVIDWHTVDFENYGDPWYEFNRIGVENPAFATGQIDGYFGDCVPEAFWELLAYYLAGSAITSIVWAKYFAPERLNEILALNESVVQWFHGMQEFVPVWYGKK